MISFPSTLNKGGYHSTPDITPSTSLKDTFMNSVTDSFRNSFINASSGIGFDNSDIRYNEDPDKNGLLDQEQNNALPNEIQYNNSLLADSSINQKNSLAKLQTIENPTHLDNDIFGIVNNYKAFIDNVLIETGNDSMDKSGKKVKTHNWKGRVAGSLFNPYYGVPYTGIVDNVPLLDGSRTGVRNAAEFAKLSDCSIKELVRLSRQKNSILGQARYKYADFMYCKDLGKISNNHLITLRKFAIPVGDNIYRQAATHNKKNNQSMPGDIGRLVCWFDTDDNKLSDILSYEYEATWRELNAKIQQLNSEEDDDARGPLGKLLNSMNPGYNKDVENGIANGGALAAVLQRFGIMMNPSTPTYASNDVALGRNYDNNKVYEPVDTIQNTHIYEGKLIFKHEFSLTFSYKLRAYDNINPKSAFLDLLGNILAVTYRKGHFWGGRQEVLGPKPNKAGWNKANAIVDSLASGTGDLLQDIFHFDFTKMGAEMSSMLNAALGALESFAPGLTSAVQQTGGAIIDAAQGAAKAITGDTDGAKQKLGEAKNNAKGAAAAAGNAVKRSNIGGALTGLIKNKLGRPSLYAFDSLLSGANVGLWHVTIGNPKNPIACFGNLIMTSAKITHSGPLGLDDFPTELKVTVSLKHARGRDATDIQKMYTKGENAIYLSLASPFTKVNTREAGELRSSEIDWDANGNPIGRAIKDQTKTQTTQANNSTPSNTAATTASRINKAKTRSRKARAKIAAVLSTGDQPIKVTVDQLIPKNGGNFIESLTELSPEERKKMSAQISRSIKQATNTLNPDDLNLNGYSTDEINQLVNNVDQLDNVDSMSEAKNAVIEQLSALNGTANDQGNEFYAMASGSAEEFIFNKDQKRG